MEKKEKQIFNAGDAKFIHEIVEEAAEKATLNTLKYLKSEEKEKDKKRYDNRLRNTELLLQNYRNFKEHIENAIYVDDELKKEDVFDEEDNDKLYINAILRTKKRTKIYVEHIDNCLSYYEAKCMKSDREDVQRRYLVIKKLYIDEEKMSYENIAKDLGNINVKTVQRTKRVALAELSSLLFRNRWSQNLIKNVSKKCPLTYLFNCCNM